MKYYEEHRDGNVITGWVNLLLYRELKKDGFDVIYSVIHKVLTHCHFTDQHLSNASSPKTENKSSMLV
jgi:hypothetical protein